MAASDGHYPAATTRREAREARAAQGSGPIPQAPPVDAPVTRSAASRSRRRVTRSGGRLVSKVMLGAAALALLSSGTAAVALTQRSANAETAAVEKQNVAVAQQQDAQIEEEQATERYAQAQQQSTRYVRAEDDLRAGGVSSANESIELASTWLDQTKDILSDDARQPLIDAIASVKKAQKSGTMAALGKATSALDQQIGTIRIASMQIPQKFNGHLPDSALCTVPFSPSQRMRCEAVRHLVQLNAAYKKRFGQDMSVSSGYRTYSNQAYLHSTSGLAGAPGRSNHGWGLAMDLSGSTLPGFGSEKDTWLLENGPKYGFLRPGWAQKGGSMPEHWHWEYTEGVYLEKTANGMSTAADVQIGEAAR